jgi:poly-gamma-glutamate synthase PgsB/CapB
MAGFSWITFKENVAIALAVADLLGVNRSSALAGMWAAPPDPGVLEVKRYAVAGKLLRVANAFAANDPRSTLMNVERLLASGAIRRPLHLVVNCRPDRLERNAQMGALVPDVDPERIVLIGTPTRSAKTAIPAEWHDVVVDLGGARDALELVEEIVSGIDDEASLIAVGNIHGQGELLLDQLATLPAAGADQPDPTPPEPPEPAPEPRPIPRPIPSPRPRPTPYPRVADVAVRRPPWADGPATQPLPRLRDRRWHRP